MRMRMMVNGFEGADNGPKLNNQGFSPSRVYPLSHKVRSSDLKTTVGAAKRDNFRIEKN
jgi:hypothetical protein